jgi:hypothetical protein
MTGPDIDMPYVVAEVTREFRAYEAALMNNDVDTLLGFFWPDERLTRYGIADRQLGITEMRSFRRATPTPTFTRRLENLRITGLGPDTAVAMVEFVRSDSALRGFQTQTWARIEGRWWVVAAHVSMIPF